MLPFEKCPVCGGEMVEKEVEKLLRGGARPLFEFKQKSVCTAEKLVFEGCD